MSNQSVAEKLEELRTVLSQQGAPVWQTGRATDMPDELAQLCPSGTQRREWVMAVSSMDFSSNLYLSVAFGWSLLTLAEILEWRNEGVAWGEEVAAEGLRGLWKPDWVPILGHDDGMIVVDEQDMTHRIFLDSSCESIGKDVVVLLGLLISLLRDGTYVWNHDRGVFALTTGQGHSVLDYG